MNELELKIFALGELFTNSYLIFNRETKEGFIIDVPHPVDELKEFIQREGLDIEFIALTHAHFDHIGGIDEFSQGYYVHEKDSPLLKKEDLNGSSFFASPLAVKREPLIYPVRKSLIDNYGCRRLPISNGVYQDASLRFCSYPIDVIHTPGHTPGSVSLKLENWLFSGDAIFFDSIGRTDIPLASSDTLLESIKEKILTLPEDTIIYPGHGESTTVGREKKHNPFLQA